MRNTPVRNAERGSHLPRVLTDLGNSSCGKHESWPNAPTESGLLWVGPVGDEQIEELHVGEFGYGGTASRRGLSLYFESRPKELLEWEERERLYRYNWPQLKRVGLRGRLEIPRGV